MKKIKLLTDNIFEAISNTEERVAILKLRTLLPKLTKSETTSLVIVLLHSYSVAIGRWVGVSALRGFSRDLADALLLIQVLSPLSKLAIAAEMLATQVESGDPWETEENPEDDEYCHE